MRGDDFVWYDHVSFLFSARLGFPSPLIVGTIPFPPVPLSRSYALVPSFLCALVLVLVTVNLHFFPILNLSA